MTEDGITQGDHFFMELFGFILATIGKLLIGYTAIRVHWRVLKEHKIDAAVFQSMRREQYLGVLGMIALVIGSLFQLPDKF